MPKVSVIVTTYNRKEYLTEAIQSILNQTYQDFELIVVDNYSNYDFSALIESFHSDKIAAFQNHNNGIIAVNRNLGISRAKGEYIAFCDDDDFWHKNKLETQTTLLQNNPDAILVSTMAKSIGIKCNFPRENFGIVNLKQVLFKTHIYYSNPIILSTVLVKKKILLAIGCFSENKNLIAVEDFDLWIRLANKGDFLLINEILVYYRIQNSNFSKNNSNTTNFNDKFYTQNELFLSRLNSRKHSNNLLVFLYSIVQLISLVFFNLKRNFRLLSNSSNIGFFSYNLLDNNLKKK